MRRAILRELRGGPRSVGEIAAGLPVSRPAVSRHLRALEDAGLVRAHAEGARNIYAVHLRGFASVRQFVDDFWDVALARLEDVAGDDRQIRVAAARRHRRAVARRG